MEKRCGFMRRAVVPCQISSSLTNLLLALPRIAHSIGHFLACQTPNQPTRNVTSVTTKTLFSLEIKGWCNEGTTKTHLFSKLARIRTMISIPSQVEYYNRLKQNISQQKMHNTNQTMPAGRADCHTTPPVGTTDRNRSTK